MKASAHQGRINDLNHWAGSEVRVAKLVLGSHLRLYLKTSSRIGPVKKIGSDTAASAMVIALRSNRVPRLSAEMEPMVSPPSSHKMAAPAARLASIGSALRIIVVTGRCSRKE